MSFFSKEKTPLINKSKQAPFSGMKTLAAGCAGFLGPWICLNTGASVALHEIVGHGYLGLALTHNYSHGNGPQYSINGFDAFDRMEDAHSANDGLQGFFSWMFQDHSTNGAVGTTTHGQGTPNELGMAMGNNGASAWVSIAGSIPGLVINTLLVSVGMSIRHKHPNLALALIIFGFENSVIEGTYAWSAAGMSDSQLKSSAANGHDFANFAVKMSAITGLDSSTIAISTALFWTGFIPLVALAIYFYQKSKQLDIVPDEWAAYYFCISTSKTIAEEVLLKKLIDDYCLVENISEECKKNLFKNTNFLDYVLENIPSKSLKKAKSDILAKWQSLQNPSKLQLILAYAMAAMLVLGMATQILGVLANTILPCLLPAVQILNCILPVLGLLSIISAGYETYNDLHCSNTQVPMLAKMISLLRLAITITIVALVITATFSSGMAPIAIPAVLAGTLLNLGLCFAKINIVQKSFKESFQLNNLNPDKSQDPKESTIDGQRPSNVL